MIVITDIAVPADQFALGALFETFPDIRRELEHIVLPRAGVVPLYWVGGDRVAIEEPPDTDSSAEGYAPTGGRRPLDVLCSGSPSAAEASERIAVRDIRVLGELDERYSPKGSEISDVQHHEDA